MFTIVQNHLLEITVVLFGIVILLQLLYYTLLFFRFSFHKPKPLLPLDGLPISIVISAKDEAHNLIKTLPVIAGQNYPNFEVVVVNDNSTDDTEFVIKDCMNRFPNIKLVNLNSSVTNIHGKKFPLSIGIKAAAYEHILLTDADCIPTSDQWLMKMARHYTGKKQMVIGYSTFYKKVGLLNGMIHYDILHSAIQYFSYYLAKMPFMGVGRNLSYTKSLFFDNKGFTSQYHLPYGDDVLFVNKVADYKICAIEYSPDAQTITRPKSHVKSWVTIKSYRNKAKKLFKPKHRFLLSVYNILMPLVYLFFGLSLYLSIHHPFYLIFVCSLMFVKYVVQYLVFGLSAKKLNEKGITPFIIFYDIIFSIINPVIFVITSLSKNK
ncbi:MAG TPA: glycosyltransferase [Bacteroidales bacterium]|nr:glycosyltransferase [Bacteroidales bacterium]HPS71079.1 glycosyltransferase [Bacteroidales bacterium]